MTDTKIVLAMDLKNLSDAQSEYLHYLRGLAQKMRMARQLQERRASASTAPDNGL